MTMGTVVWNHDPLQVEDSEWHIIEDARNIESSDRFVDQSSDFVEERPLHELDIFTLGHYLWSMVHNFMLKLVVHEGLEVDVADLHDDFESDEVHDAMRDGVLQGKHMKIDNFGCESHEHLNQSNDKRNFRAAWNELITLIVSELHKVHSFGDFRI